jgi:hypothetical protein
VSSDPKYIIGDLVQLGTPEGSDQPRALIHCRESDIAAVKYAPILRRVAIVPLDNLNGSDVPPIMAENRRLLEQVARCQDVIYCLELCRSALEHHEEVKDAHGALEMHRHLYEIGGIAIRALVAYGVTQDQGYWAGVEQYRARMLGVREAPEDKGGAA